MPDPIAGVDPGFEGAVGAIDGESGSLEVLYDMPLRDKGNGRAREVDIQALNGIFVDLKNRGVADVNLEWPTTRPDEASEASKRFGVGLGNVEALVVANGMKLHRVAPNKWKQDLGLPGKKNGLHTAIEARRLACDESLRLVPGITRDHVYGPRGGPKDGRAEALLIAFWAWSRTVPAMRVLAERWGKDSVQSQAFMLMGGRRGRKVKPGPMF